MGERWVGFLDIAVMNNNEAILKSKADVVQQRVGRKQLFVKI